MADSPETEERPSWNDRYLTDDLPWDTGVPEEHLVEHVRSGGVPAGAAVLEIGCGTGTNAVWLARQGFRVTACDVAPRALERARERAAREGVADACQFIEVDILAKAPPGGPFAFAFDRGVLHVFDEASDRALFAERVASVLEPGGHWLGIEGSTEGPPRDHGPPRRSLRDLAAAIEPHLELVSVQAGQFEANLPSAAAAWIVLSRRRTIAAQPSTRRAARSA